MLSPSNNRCPTTVSINLNVLEAPLTPPTYVVTISRTCLLVPQKLTLSPGPNAMAHPSTCHAVPWEQR